MIGETSSIKRYTVFLFALISQNSDDVQMSQFGVRKLFLLAISNAELKRLLNVSLTSASVPQKYRKVF